MILERAIEPAAITTERLKLAPCSVEHAGAIAGLLADWDIVRMLASVPWPVTRAGVEAYLERCAPARESADFVLFAEGRLVGVASLKLPGSGSPPRAMPRLGYWIGREYWNRGFATEALRAVISYSFRVFPHGRIGAGVFHDNPASLQVLEKLGFRQQGRYETTCLARGVSVPTIDMQLARADWQRDKR